MKERPILFKGEMVRAIQRGQKTQTRRLIKPQPFDALPDGAFLTSAGLEPIRVTCPYGMPGDRLWVRETWATGAEWNQCSPKNIFQAAEETGYADDDKTPVSDLWYMADDSYRQWGSTSHKYSMGRIRSSLHMPRWASRIPLEVTGVRVERVQDISPDDAYREGVDERDCPIIEGASNCCVDYRYGFSLLWDSINEGRGFGWQSNPWVWVVEFRRV